MHTHTSVPTHHATMDTLPAEIISECVAGLLDNGSMHSLSRVSQRMWGMTRVLLGQRHHEEMQQLRCLLRSHRAWYNKQCIMMMAAWGERDVANFALRGVCRTCDPLQYWSDVYQDTVHEDRLENGSHVQVLASHGVFGTVVNRPMMDDDTATAQDRVLCVLLDSEHGGGLLRTTAAAVAAQPLKRFDVSRYTRSKHGTVNFCASVRAMQEIVSFAPMQLRYGDAGTRSNVGVVLCAVAANPLSFAFADGAAKLSGETIRTAFSSCRTYAEVKRVSVLVEGAYLPLSVQAAIRARWPELRELR